jgi:cysteine desulfurase family protein
MVYFDNAATSWPKPEAVYQAMDHCMRQVGANPGRSGHKMSVEAERIVLNARELLADLFGVKDSSRIILTFNATDSLNLAIKCLLRQGDHVVTSAFEHNSVIRPLRRLEQQGVIEITIVPCTKEGFLDPAEVEKNIRPNTRMVTLIHASNVTGTLMPVEEVGEIVSKYDGVYYMIDAAQTAGVVPIDVKRYKLDLLAFPGHKCLFGPQGTGGLYVGEGLEDIMPSLKEGGTGSLSEQEVHPDFLPDKYESGTKNTVGLAGLAAGVEFIMETGMENIHKHEQQLTEQLIKGLQQIDGVILYGPQDANRQTSVISINIEGLRPNEVGYYLDQQEGIMTRVGLHCAPLAHKSMGTAPDGTVRLSLGYFSTPEEVDYVCRAIRKLAKEGIQ